MMIRSVGLLQFPAVCSVSESSSSKASLSQFSGLKIAEPVNKLPKSLRVSSSSRKNARIIVSQGAATEEAAVVPAEEISRLTPRVELVDGYWRLRDEFRSGINPAEKAKLEAEPMKLWTERGIDELAKIPFAEIEASKLLKDDIDVRLKWLGLFHRRKHQYGRFMMRLKLPNGITTSEQTRYLASVIEKYGAEGCADVTTRQNWQIRGVLLEDVPEIMDGLTRVGLTSIQSGMDNVRNAVGNPIAGIDPHEIVDTRPYIMALNDYIINRGKGNLEITNLPRKWNVCVVGTHDMFEHPHINDLAYIPAMKDGKFGFNLLVGGFFSSKRDAEAIPLDAWVAEDDVVPLCKAMLEAFRDLGYRGNRQKCRMMWLIDELGMEAFRAEVEKRLPSQKLERAAEKDLIDMSWKRRDLLGVQQQKQPGLSFVGIHVPVGRLQAADMYEFARLADEYGSGELRLTVEQNIIIPNVPEAKVAQLLSEPLVSRFGAECTPLLTQLVSCTGKQFCGMAIIETKNRALEITKELESSMNFTRPVRMHWTGCPNSCAQVQVADIGFMGTMARDENKKPVDGVDIFLGGKVGADSHLGEKVRSNIPVKDLIPVVQDLLIEHFGATRKA